jgi:putative heme iron utilization protein
MQVVRPRGFSQQQYYTNQRHHHLHGKIKTIISNQAHVAFTGVCDI